MPVANNKTLEDFRLNKASGRAWRYAINTMQFECKDVNDKNKNLNKFTDKKKA